MKAKRVGAILMAATLTLTQAAAVLSNPAVVMADSEEGLVIGGVFLISSPVLP